MLMFFVTKYSKNKVYGTTRGFRCPTDAYCDALRAHQKKWYDFASKPGYGSLLVNGVHNPVITVGNGMDALNLPLPKLTALKWVIDHGFDEHFFVNYRDVKHHYNLYRNTKKKRYTDTHKQKKREIRREMESKVFSEKVGEEERQRELVEMGMEDTLMRKKCTSSSQTKKKRKRRSKNKTKTKKSKSLSRADRRRVVTLIKEEMTRRQESAKMDKIKTKRQAVTPVYKTGLVAESAVVNF
jgi:hypothetical protein